MKKKAEEKIWDYKKDLKSKFKKEIDKDITKLNIMREYWLSEKQINETSSSLYQLMIEKFEADWIKS